MHLWLDASIEFVYGCDQQEMTVSEQKPSLLLFLDLITGYYKSTVSHLLNSTINFLLLHVHASQSQQGYTAYKFYLLKQQCIL